MDINHLFAAQRAHRTTQRELLQSPWQPWMLPVALAVLCFPSVYAVEWAARSLVLLPPGQPGLLVLFCLGAAFLCVPLYRADHVRRSSLIGVLLYHAVFVHYVAAYAFHVGGRGLGNACGIVDLAVAAHLFRCGMEAAFFAEDLRQSVWSFCTFTGPLCLVPQVLALLVLSL